MKAIILAAGQGTRLRPLTDSVPKCMVKYKNKCLIDYILETLRACSITDITIVKGYKHEALIREGTKNYINENFANTNMLSTLFCAEAEFNDDLIISYSDIIYTKRNLSTLIESNDEFSVLIDKSWKELWQKRMEDPITDAETLVLDESENIIELGKKPKSLEQIQGQYMGLIKIKRSSLANVQAFYHSLDKKQLYDGKDFNNMYMTSFIQLVIQNLMPVKAVSIAGGWLEIDAINDLKVDIDLS